MSKEGSRKGFVKYPQQQIEQELFTMFQKQYLLASRIDHFNPFYKTLIGFWFQILMTVCTLRREKEIYF